MDTQLVEFLPGSGIVNAANRMRSGFVNHPRILHLVVGPSKWIPHLTDLVPYLWGAGGIQLAIAAANIVLPRKLRYGENLKLVEPIIRQVFVVHSVYILYVLVAFAVICFAFAPELTGATPLGRFMSAWLALFWAPRLIVQWTYYDRELRRQKHVGHWGFSLAILYLIIVFAAALGVAK